MQIINDSKTLLSSDCNLELNCMKLDSIVIAGQHTAVNIPLIPELTARQVLRIVLTEEVSIKKKFPR